MGRLTPTNIKPRRKHSKHSRTKFSPQARTALESNFAARTPSLQPTTLRTSTRSRRSCINSAHASASSSRTRLCRHSKPHVVDPVIRSQSKLQEPGSNKFARHNAITERWRCKCAEVPAQNVPVAAPPAPVPSNHPFGNIFADTNAAANIARWAAVREPSTLSKGDVKCLQRPEALAAPGAVKLGSVSQTGWSSPSGLGGTTPGKGAVFSQEL